MVLYKTKINKTIALYIFLNFYFNFLMKKIKKIQFQTAYECYNYYWQHDPAFQNQPMREPRQLPKPRTKNPPPSNDPNPEEPPDQQNQQQQQRRRQRRRNTSSSSFFSEFSAAVSDQSQFYAEKAQRKKRVKEMCTNEYLRKLGVTPHPYSRDP